MQQSDINLFLTTTTDGQFVRLTLVSGRVFEGIYDEEATEQDGAALHFETIEGQALRAEWVKIEAIDYRRARTVGASIMVPPEHPLSGQGPVGVREDGVPLRAHTVRNR